MDQQQSVTSQQGHDGSGTTMAEILTSLVREMGIKEGTTWVLIKQSANSYALLEGITNLRRFREATGNHGLELIASGSAGKVCRLEFPHRAEDLLSMIRGLPIYRLVGSEVQLIPGTAEVPVPRRVSSQYLKKSILAALSYSSGSAAAHWASEVKDSSWELDDYELCWQKVKYELLYQSNEEQVSRIGFPNCSQVGPHYVNVRGLIEEFPPWLPHVRFPSGFNVFLFWSWWHKAGGRADPVNRSSILPIFINSSNFGTTSTGGHLSYEAYARHGDIVLNQGYPPATNIHVVTTAGAGTSSGGGRSLGNLEFEVADGGGGLGHLESHGSSPTRPTGCGLGQDAQIRRSMTTPICRCAGYGTTATGGGQADLEAQEHSAQQPSLTNFFCQAFATIPATCPMAYSALKDAPDHVKLISFGGLGIIIIALFTGMVSRSSARRHLAFRLVSCAAVTLLTFSVASQLSGPTYITLTAIVGGLLNFFIMLLRF